MVFAICSVERNHCEAIRRRSLFTLVLSTNADSIMVYSSINVNIKRRFINYKDMLFFMFYENYCKKKLMKDLLDGKVKL